jgi:hypothetical protein
MAEVGVARAGAHQREPVTRAAGQAPEDERAGHPPDRRPDSDYKGAAPMLADLPAAKVMLADRGYGAAWLRNA